MRLTTSTECNARSACIFGAGVGSQPRWNAARVHGLQRALKKKMVNVGLWLYCMLLLLLLLLLLLYVRTMYY